MINPVAVDTCVMNLFLNVRDGGDICIE